MCCARRWARLKRQPPATRFAPRSIDCTNTQSGSKAPSFSPASSHFFLPRGRNLPSFRLALRLRLLFFQGTPQIPACNRAVGAPALAVFKNYLRFGDVLVSIHPLETLSNSVVVCRQDVWPAEPRHQKHLHGPLTDSMHASEAFVDFFFAHAANLGKRRDGAIERLCRQVLHGRDFLPRKSGAPQFRFRFAQKFFRGRKAAR